MRLGLFLTTLIGLAGISHISSAADATWVAVAALENPACATQFGGPPCGGTARAIMTTCACCNGTSLRRFSASRAGAHARHHYVVGV